MILTGTGVFSNHGSLTLISIGEEINFQNSDTIEFSVIKDPITGSTVSASVSYSSLTASHLNTGTNGGATAGYLLSSDVDGNFKWVDNTSFGAVGGIPTIDDKNYMMSFDTSGDNASTGLFITNTPIDGSHVFVTVNGQYFNVGNGVSTSSSCYFSNDGGITAKEFTSPNQITAGDELYWNGTVVGTDLYTSWSISIYYEI